MAVILANQARRRTLLPLQALNFFMADMQAGIGPFLGVFLLAHGWHNGWIGAVIGIGGLAGMAAATPAGALIDASSRKRWYVIVPGFCMVMASALILFSPSFMLVAGSQIVAAIAGAAIGPAVSGMTLGIVHQAGFNRQMGINQAFNHAGNLVGAGLSGLLGWRFGMAGVVGLAAMRLGEKRGLWIVLLISFAALPVRGLIAALWMVHWGVYPVQLLDGVGAGLQSVAVPALVARILNGTGHINTGQGVVMTVQGIGAALSPVIGGWMSQEFGYSATFIALGCCALVSVVLWVSFRTPISAAATMLADKTPY